MDTQITDCLGKRPWLGALCALLAAAGVGLSTQPAWAADAFEIQVYEDDVNEPMQFALEVHTNYSASARKTAAWPGEYPPHGVGRMTLEPALGVTDFLEVGAYLQFMAVPDHGVEFAGWKLRSKWVVPQRLRLPVMLGINIEVGRVPAFVERDGWANEFRPILGWSNGRITALLNPIFGWALTGPEAFKPDFEPCGKLSWNTQRGFALGAEYYAGLGQFSEGFLALRQQEHMLYATFDLTSPDPDKASAWELNLALGHSLTAASDVQWSVKTIVGRAF